MSKNMGQHKLINRGLIAAAKEVLGRWDHRLSSHWEEEGEVSCKRCGNPFSPDDVLVSFRFIIRGKEMRLSQVWQERDDNNYDAEIDHAFRLLSEAFMVRKRDYIRCD